MQQLKGLILLPLIIAVVIYGGIKAYVYFNVKGKLDDAIVQASSIAQISYGGISSSLDGSIEIDTIEVKTPQQPTPIRLGVIQLQGSGIGFLFDVAKGFRGGSLPATMQIYLKRLELPDVQQIARSMLPTNRGLLDLPPGPCDLGGVVRDAGMMSSDTYPIYLDLNMGYQMDPQTGSGRLEFGYVVHDGESLATEVELSNMPQPGAVMMGMVPAVDRVTIRYRPNSEFLLARVKECAKKRGTSESAYVHGLLAQPARVLAKELGFVPGAGLRQGIERFLLQPEEIVAVAGPIEQPMLLGSGQMQPAQIVDYVDLRVSVNSEPLTDLSFTPAGDLPTGSSGDSDATQATQPGKKARRRARYIQTPIVELGQYFGRPVQLKVVGRDDIQSGVLVGMGNGKVNVEKRLRHGKMTLHIDLEKIERIEVLRFPPTAE